MVDRFLSGALNAMVLTLASGLAGAALFCAHSGALGLLSGQWPTGAGVLAGALGLSIAAVLVIRYRNDLADR